MATGWTLKVGNTTHGSASGSSSSNGTGNNNSGSTTQTGTQAPTVVQETSIPPPFIVGVVLAALGFAGMSVSGFGLAVLFLGENKLYY